MGIVQNLSVLALRQLIGPAPQVIDPGAGRLENDVVASLADQFSHQGPRLRSALYHANECAWDALEIALGGDSLWERSRGALRRSADQSFRRQLRTFLDVVAAGHGSGRPAARLSSDVRQEYLRDLRAARKDRILTGGSVDLHQLAEQLAGLITLADPQQSADAERRLLEQMADELRQLDHAALGQLLAESSPGDSVLVNAASYFLRRQVEADRHMLKELPLRPVDNLAPAQQEGYEALAQILAQHRQQLKALLDEVLGISTPSRGEVLDVPGELERLGPALREMGQQVLQLVERHHLEHRELRTDDSLSIRDEGERQAITEAVARFRTLPGEQRQQLPALGNAIGKLEVVAGEFEAAKNSFMDVLPLLSDSRAQAEVWHNAYQAALEQRDWDSALTALVQSAQLDPERFAPFPVQNYEPECILGAGGSAVTFLGLHRSSGTRVLIKSLRADYLAREVAQIFTDTQVLQEIDHPAILPILESDFADTSHLQPYLVMDYFEGQTLAEYVQQHGSLTPEDLLAVARPVAEALQAVHARGMLHRGIKPSNLLVHRAPGVPGEGGPTWHVRLIDFGLSLRPEVLQASGINPNARLRTTVGSSVASTLDYAAPEKLGRLEGGVVGPHSDVYSFGRTCYFALLGSPEPDDEERENLPPGWRKLLSSCTARALAKRLPDFSAVLERLAQFPAAVPPAPPAPTPPSVDQAEVPRLEEPAALTPLQRGLAAHNKGDYDHAIAELTEAIDLDPTSTLAYANRGDSHRLKGDFDQAIADFAQALRLDPDNALAYINQGIAYRHKGELDQAITNYTEALRLDPNNALAYNNRANAFADKGDHARAIADYSEALRLNPEYAWAYHNRGNAYTDKGEYDQAIADFNRAIRLEPNYAVAYVSRGDAYRAKGEYDKAIADFSDALRLDPNYTLAYVNRGDTYRLKGEYDRAIADFTEAMGLDPTDAMIYRNRGIAYRMKGDYDRAIADFTQALRIDPTLALAYNNRGNVYSARGEYDRAIADFSEAIKVEPTLALAYMNRGLAHAKKGAFDAVIADCSAALRLDPKLATAHFIRGAAFATKGEYDKAIADFTRTVRLEPRHALAYNDRGLAYANKKDYDQAIADYTEALKIEPRYALAYANRGIAFRLRGDPDRAIADFSRALRLDAKMALAYYHRGLAYIAKEDFDRAIADYTLAHRLDPHNPDIFTRRDEALKAKNEYLKKRKERRLREAQAKADEERRQREAAAYFIRAKSHADKGEHDDAIIDYTEALRLDPQDSLAHFHRGLSYLARQDHDLAIADFGEAIRLNPRNAEFYFQRGVAHRMRSKYDKAIADFDQTLKIDPHHAEAANRRDEANRTRTDRPKPEEKRGSGGHVSKANQSFDKGEFDRAIGHYTDALKQDPSKASSYQARALAYEHKGEFDRAIADYTEVLKLAPRDPAGYQARGGVYHRTGDYDRAIGDFSQAIKIDAESPFAYYHRGLAFLAKDEFPRAIADFTRALKLDPKYAVAFGYRGQAYRLNGQYEKAVADCDEALRLDPQYALAYRNRGLAYAALGEHAKAKLDYEASIRLDPTLAPT